MTRAPDDQSLNFRLGEDRTALTVSDHSATCVAAGHSARHLAGGSVNLVERSLTSPHAIDKGECLVRSLTDLGVVDSEQVAVLHQLHFRQSLVVGRNQTGRSIRRQPVLYVDGHDLYIS